MSSLFKGENYFEKGSIESMKGLEIDVDVSISSVLFSKEGSDYGVYIGYSKEYGYIEIQAEYEGGLIVGKTYKIVGKVVEYNGRSQVRARDIINCKPVGTKGIIAYLQTLEGLGSRAYTIYQEFKEDSIETIIKNPKLVSDKIRGIGYNSVLKWQKELLKLDKEQNIYMTLLDYGIKQKDIKILVEKYKDKTLVEVQKNPYILCDEINSFSFKKADKIALEMGVKPNNKNRVGEALKYILENSKMQGNCYLPRISIYPLVSEIVDLKLDFDEMEEIYSNNKSKVGCHIVRNMNLYFIDTKELKECIDRYKVSKDNAEREGNRYLIYSLKDKELDDAINYLRKKEDIVYENGNIYLEYIYTAEMNFAKHIKNLTKYKLIHKRERVEAVLDEICLEKGYKLEYMQREACIEFNMYGSGVYILNGPAGTGKTFTFNLILEVSKRLNSDTDINFLPLAPTGKASKVVTKAIGKECVTIHRALSLTSNLKKKAIVPGGIQAKNIMCDETGMLDIEIGSLLLESIKRSSKLILSGDVNQLLSVGPGNVLRDLIESNIVKCVTLNVTKRQGKGSNITYNGNKVLEGKMIDLSNKYDDFFFLERHSNFDVSKTIIDSFKRLLSYKEFTIDDIQVLIPQKNGQVGVHMINYLLQKEFNKTTNSKYVLKRKFVVCNKEYKLSIKVGDKVMYTKNNYECDLYRKNSIGEFELKNGEKGLTNGECGRVEDIRYKEGNPTLVIKFDVGYAFCDNIDEIELNYATTFHKSQGSSWKVVIAPIIMAHERMLSKNLFYTGITRASDKCVLIGSKEAVIYAINCTKPSQRYTTLKQRLLA